MEIVECRSDTEYAERPVSFIWNGQHMEVEEIIARWRTPQGKFFRVRTTGEKIYELEYREVPGEWLIKPL